MVPTASVIKLDDRAPLDKAALLGCGVTTGYGSAVRTGDVQPGDTVVVMGIGGVGVNAIQGARIAGARNFVAIDRSTTSSSGPATSARHTSPRRSTMRFQWSRT